MKSLFTFLILFFIAYYFVKAIYRLIAIFLNKDNSNKKWSSNKNGKVTIDLQEKQKKRFDKDEGDYIDYEEMK
jgi:hypothetical protein